MEVLQVVQYLLKQQLREGVGPWHLLACEEELQDELITPQEAPQLLHEGQIQTFLQRVREAHEG